MAVIVPTGFKLLGATRRKSEAVNAFRRRLAALHGIAYNDIGHCIDSFEHPVFGKNERFIVMRDASSGTMYLTKVGKDGTREVVPHYQYLGSVKYSKLKSHEGHQLLLHFYVKSHRSLEEEQTEEDEEEKRRQ